jgi:hypothetical protein
MSQLYVSFYGEGPTEYMFLAPLVERLLRNLLPYVDIVLISRNDLDVSGLSQVEKIILLAQKTSGLVIFHLDADSPNTRKAYEERFKPGIERLLKISTLNQDFVPIIPVRMTEAWMMVDYQAFREAIDTDVSAHELGFLDKPHQVESIPDAKAAFYLAVSKARPGQRHKRKPQDIYGVLASEINLDLLRLVPAYAEFLERLIEMLRHLHYDVEL